MGHKRSAGRGDDRRRWIGLTVVALLATTGAAQAGAPGSGGPATGRVEAAAPAVPEPATVSAAVDASATTSAPASLPDLPWQLTARPWRPTYLSRSAFLDVGESIARASALNQGDDGAIRDTYSGREQQYQTPYFAASVALLVSNGRARDLLPQGIAAMDRATRDLTEGRSGIPENHGEFFVAPLAQALPLLRPHVPAETYEVWRKRLATPLSRITRGEPHNWQSYAMKGEWLRVREGYVDRAAAVDWLEKSWSGSQLPRLQGPWRLYRDRSTNPDTHAYDAAARSNLLSMVVDGYDGPSRQQMTDVLSHSGRTGLLMQDPSGQNPAGGRSGAHVWNDVYAGNGFAQLAGLTATTDPHLAGQYRHAALLNLQGIQRWRRADGTYSVTKNHFDPADRIGYAAYSWFTNYNGNVMYHSLESHELSARHIAERPVPAEIGGYAFTTDPAFASAFANAGGMHVQAALRGQREVHKGQYWTALGISRFARTGWDSRLGPPDGYRHPDSGQGVTFAPTFVEDGRWVRLADVPERYAATATVDFVHPLLVRWTLDYAPLPGRSGPRFRDELVVTPDGVLSTVTSTAERFGTTLPVLESDGRPTTTRYGDQIAEVSYPGGTDSQSFIGVQPDAELSTSDPTIQSAVGTLRPARLTVPGAAANEVFVYPRSAGDPTAEQVRSTFSRSGDDFSSVLGRVDGTTYVGRTSAGGFTRALDLDDDGTDDVVLGADANVVLQLHQGRVVAVETDRPVTATVQGRRVELAAHTPVWLTAALPVTATASAAQRGNEAAKAADGSLSTRWAAQGVDQWLTLDTGSVHGLSTLDLAWHQGSRRAARFHVEVSSDGSTWTRVASAVGSSGTTTRKETYPLGMVEGRYVRVVNAGSPGTSWISITEAAVTGM